MAISFNDEESLDYITWYHDGVLSSGLGVLTWWDYFDDGAIVDDWIAFVRYLHKIKGVRVHVNTAVVATTFTTVWEYYRNDDTWQPLTGVTDPSNGFQNTGNHLITWDMPTDWKEIERLDGVVYYNSGCFVRCRITAVSGITEGGRNGDSPATVQSYAVRITGAASHTPEDLYQADLTGAWGVVTKDSLGKNYLVNANLIVEDGTLAVKDHNTLTVGAVAGDGNESYSLEVYDDGIIQIGEKSAEGYGYNMGILIYNNGHQWGAPNEWTGVFKCYGSKFWIYDYGTAGAQPWTVNVALSFNGEVDILDSGLEFGQDDNRFYFNIDSFGNVKRGVIGGYSIGFETPDLIMDAIGLTPDQQGQAMDKMIAGGSSWFPKITNTDFQDTIDAELLGGACFGLEDCSGFSDGQVSLTGDSPTASHLQRKFTVKLRVTDIDGDPIVGAKVYLEDVDGRSAWFEDLTEMDNESARTRFTQDPAWQTLTVVDSANYAVGEVIKCRGELMLITAIPSGATLTVTRNYAGSTANGGLMSYNNVWRRLDYVETDSNGEVFYDTTREFLVTVKDYPRLNNVNLTVKDFNDFQLRIEKTGFNNFKSTVSINDNIDWGISMVSPCDPWTIAEINAEAAAGYDHTEVANYPMSWNDAGNILTIWGDDGSGGKEAMGYDADHPITMEEVWAFAAYTKGTCICSKDSDDAFTMKARLLVGDGTETTFFASENQSVWLYDYFKVKNKAVMRMGSIATDANNPYPDPKWGACWTIERVTLPDGFNNCYFVENGGELYVYDSRIALTDNSRAFDTEAGAYTFIGYSTFAGYDRVDATYIRWWGVLEFDHMTLHHCRNMNFPTPPHEDSAYLNIYDNQNDLQVRDAESWIWDATLANAITCACKVLSNGKANLVDPVGLDYDKICVQTAGIWQKLWHRFAIKVKDEDDTAISGATVIVKDKDGTEVYNETSDGTGWTPVGTPADTSRLIKEWQTDGIGGTGITYPDDFDIRNPHTLTVEADGKQTYTEKFDIEARMDKKEIRLYNQVDLFISKGKAAINTDPENPESDILV